MKLNQAKNQGFTLIELIVVIVILGIMAAVAGPRFVNLQEDARKAVLDGVEASVRSASTLVHSRSLIDGTEGNATGSAAVDGVAGGVDIVYGYPAATADGIGEAVEISGDVTHAGGVFTVDGKANCTVTYTAAPDGGVPGITADDSGC